MREVIKVRLGQNSLDFPQSLSSKIKKKRKENLLLPAHMFTVSFRIVLRAVSSQSTFQQRCGELVSPYL